MSKLKYSIFISLAVIIGFAAYTTVLFLLAPLKNDVFYINYGFTIFATLAFWGSMMSVMIKPQSFNEAFLHEPYMSAAVIYAVAQVVLSVYSVFYGQFSFKIALSANVLLCGLYLTTTLFLIVGINLNKTIEAQIKTKRQFLRDLTLELSGLQFSSDEAKSVLKELCDDVRYSDPMSTQKQAEVETQILSEIKNLSGLNEVQAVQKMHQIKDLLKKRNHLIKFS